MKKKSLIKSFSIYSLIAFIITGIVLSYFISDHIKEDKLANFKDISYFVVDNIVKDSLSESDFKGIIESSKRDSIIKSMNNARDYYKMISITIINSEETVILSSGGLLNEEKVVKDTNVDKILNSKLGESYIITKPYKLEIAGENLERKEVFNIYTAVTYGQKIIGVYKIIVPYEEISTHINMLKSIIYKTLFLGLLILFLLLMKIIHNASKTLVNQNKELNEKKIKLEESYKKLNGSYKNTVVALSNAVDARDQYTAGHSTRVAEISLEIGKALGFLEENLTDLECAALFHDIGKIGIPDYILNKNEKLTNEEYDKIKQHPEIGVSILKTIDFMKEGLPIIRYHHERYDGRGYPTGIDGENIPLGARIIAIADTYDAMTSNRPYRNGLSHEIAINEILLNKGLQFDGTLVDVFMTIEQKIKTICKVRDLR
ncbi:MAG: hypothetical protein CVU84_10270 [Firmicutes bacterium HGW-Firmicutes-1]|jgi:putative nucleotidyltransferase with HDIG domain|nr:MAG: hypothetical protein CVU84_10270 [Firmicutes bacterium HGW-Firmicutes-1]